LGLALPPERPRFRVPPSRAIRLMTHRPRSLKSEYELYIEHELEAYKESVPRSVLLCIGDEAVAALAAGQQLALTELLLWEEVDRIIRERLRLPSFRTWCRKRLKALEEFRRPERWGLSPTGVLARSAPVVADGHVLVAGARAEGPAIFLAANGCAVTALDPVEHVVERVMHAAVEVGLAGRVRALVSDLGSWSPDLPLSAVVCAPPAFEGLTADERAHAITMLQEATTAGGLHIVEHALGNGLVSLTELRDSYLGWQVSVERESALAETFLARKVA
jgi:hypothetical protein